MLDSVLPYLCCPHCEGTFHTQARMLVCERGHAFDVARQGFVNLLGKAPPPNADGADMVEARARFLGAGFYDPMADAVARLATERTHAMDARKTCILDVGAGHGFYLSRVLDACVGFAGIALDISKFAARRAARCHAHAGTIVADALGVLPIRSQAVALILSVFAPRNLPELHRVLNPDGCLLVVTPGPDHLASLRQPLGLLNIEAGKDERLLMQTADGFTVVHEETLDGFLSLQRSDALALLSMGPAAYHLAPDVRAARVASLAEPITAHISFTLRAFKPIGHFRS